MADYCVYILKCADGSYYTGCTSNLQARLTQHREGVFPGYTKSRLPVRLVFSQSFSDVEDAARAERQIKGWTRRKKAALVAGDFDLLHELARCANPSRFDRPK